MASAKKRPAKKATGKPTGRPSAFRDEFAGQALMLCRLGATDKDMAEFFGVSEQTVNAWKKAHPEFLEALKEGKTMADAEVADRLYKRATGYSHVDTKFATHEGKITDREEYTKHYAPDTVACIFWLKNRRPDLWRDNVGLEHSGKIKASAEVSPEMESKILELTAAAASIAATVQPPASFRGNGGEE